MFENKYINLILDRLPKKYWNNFSRFIAFFSLRTIGSPIEFSYSEFTLREYDLLKTDETFLNKFLDFCYPADEIPDREKEIQIDKQYWPATSTYIITRNGDEKIVGCIQAIEKTDEIKLPVEYSSVKEQLICDSDSGWKTEVPHGRMSEIYRCRKAADVIGKDAVIVISMLFKAIWAMSVNKSMDYSVLSFNSSNHQLHKMYTRKLNFKDSGIEVQYSGSPNMWKLLFCKWTDQEENYSSISKAHFHLLTWFRSGMILERSVVQEAQYDHPLITEEETILFANVFTAQTDGITRKKLYPVSQT
jgi:hypothetical protein